MSIAIIVAVAENGVIGKDNQLIWRLSSDLKRFKALTMGSPILMGRKTHESIGKALPGRENIILTRNKEYQAEGCRIINDLKAFIDSRKDTEEKIFIIGGEEIYRLSLEFADEVHLTRVHTNIDGDAFFPELNSNWKEVDCTKHQKDEKNEYDYSFLEYQKV